MHKDPHAERIWTLCQQCAVSVYPVEQYSVEYCDRVAKLLFGTAAQESGLRWERQRTPRWDGAVGGFSKWQVETGSIKQSIALMSRRPLLAERATKFLFNDPNAPTSWLSDMTLDAILWAMRMDDNDKIGVLFCRLHYLRVADPVPYGLGPQADYWKRYYNTMAGKGTCQEYLDNWNRYCREIAE